MGTYNYILMKLKNSVVMAATEDLGQCTECKDKVGAQFATLVRALTSDWGKGEPVIAKKAGSAGGNPDLL